METYSDVPKYLELQFLEAHEGTGDLLKHFDNPLERFLEWLETKGFLEGSLLLIVADHGMHMRGPYYFINSTEFYIDRALPLMILAIDDSLLSQS